MHLQDGTRTHFMNFSSREFPSMLPRFERLYTGKYAPAAYREEVQGMVRVLQDRYGLAKRGEELRRRLAAAIRGACSRGGAGGVRLVRPEQDYCAG